MEEDETIPISALQHWLFCARQCALIHVEQAWEENRLTAEGRLLHKTADQPSHETRAGVRLLRGALLRSERLGVWGKADIVELRENGAPYPVEYKRGRPKDHRADEVQLCAQAMALEEMFGMAVPEGCLFYGETRRRLVVAIDEELRALTARVADEVRTTLTKGVIPPPVYERRRCDACSLIDLCRPKALEHPPSVSVWLAKAIARDTETEQ